MAVTRNPVPTNAPADAQIMSAQGYRHGSFVDPGAIASSTPIGAKNATGPCATAVQNAAVQNTTAHQVPYFYSSMQIHSQYAFLL